MVDPVISFLLRGVSSAPPFFYVYNYTIFDGKSQEESAKKRTFFAKKTP